MSLEENKAVVRRFAEECWNAGKLDVLDEWVADDPVRSGTPVGQRGRAGHITMARTALATSRAAIEALGGMVDADVVIAACDAARQLPAWPGPHYRETNPVLVANARHVIQAVLAAHPRRRTDMA